MIPLFLDLRGKKAIVFGCGPVGQRKAVYLAKQADVTVVDRSPGPAPEGARRILGDARSHLHLLQQADLVVAATEDGELNDLICREASDLGIWFNRADGTGSFLIPSVVERRNFTVAVSTEGRSPGMSRHIREHLDLCLPPEWEDMVQVMEMVRQELRSVVEDPHARERTLRTLSEDQEVWEALSSGTEAAFRTAMRKAVR
ncbi:MAG: bifunctional precorrin-2 dehydrogenase/sirohydrochlorin ferrochelatase [Methanomassiliicoccales archaeon]|nr:bifunctional precorrin-2 dehydrogenase/sirohydrochlorin ferrochelatase [Methanomassiliicoccales archaeon]